MEKREEVGDEEDRKERRIKEKKSDKIRRKKWSSMNK